MKGKEKCRILRQIRAEIAAKNDIELVTSECAFQGECRGTCPKCEAEVRYLEAELLRRSRLQKRVALAGVSIGTMMALTGCNAVEAIVDNLPLRPTKPPYEELLGEVDIELVGDVAYEAQSES